MIRINVLPRNSVPWTRLARLTFLSAVLFLALLAGTISHARETFIIDGERVAFREFPAIFSIKMQLTTQTGEGTPVNLCTAFLVHPRLILTAAHCLRNTASISSLSNDLVVEAYEQLQFGVSDLKANPDYERYRRAGMTAAAAQRLQQLEQPEEGRAIQADLLHNVSTAEARMIQADIGYVLLQADVKKIEPLEIYSTTNDEARATLVDQIATFVGYGANIWQKSGHYSFSASGVGVKRKGTKALSAAKDGILYFGGAEFGALPGDSGGPVMMTIDGKPRVVAINSKMSSARAPDTTVDKNIDGAKKRKIKEPKLDHYEAAYASPLTPANLCWVERESGIDIPGIDCAN